VTTRARIFVQLGTPTAPTAEAVRRFLDEFLSDPMVVERPRWLWLPILKGIVLRKRPARVAELYRSIWTEQGSPLQVGTRAITEAVAAAAADERVSFASRYGPPSLREAVTVATAECERVVVVPLYAQRTASSTGTVEEQVLALARELGALERVALALPAPDDAGMIAAVAARCREAFGDTRPQHLVVSFHGLPVSVDEREGHVYTRDCRRTCDALLAALDWSPDDATLAHQSRFGPERWLGPATDEVLEALPGRGVRSVAVIAPGFLTDGLETLEELGQQGRESFLAAGGEAYVLVPAAGDHPDLVASLAALGT
jgi:ferrochelatase